MMGYSYTQNSFRQSFRYCLEDKLTQDGQVIFKDRAEILYYHQCHGDKEELIRQFREVAALDLQISKPVLSINLSLPLDEHLPKSTLIQLARECSRDLGFEKHQYIVILHKDTPNQHIHLLANRIGFDKHVHDNSHSYRKIADYCRQAEHRHNLTLDPGPIRYRTEEQRQVPRHGIRLDRLKENIGQALLLSHDLKEFKVLMEEKGYTVYDSQRGFAFMDDDHVIFRGHETGYPFHKIQSILSRDLSLRQEEEKQRLEKELLLQLEQELRQHQAERLEQRHHQRHSQQLSL